MKNLLYKIMRHIIEHTKTGRAIITHATRAGYEIGLIKGHERGAREAWLLAGEVVSLGDSKRAAIYGEDYSNTEAIMHMPYKAAKNGYDYMIKKLNVFTRERG